MLSSRRANRRLFYFILSGEPCITCGAGSTTERVVSGPTPPSYCTFIELSPHLAAPRFPWAGSPLIGDPIAVAQGIFTLRGERSSISHYVAHRAHGKRMWVFDDDRVGISELGRGNSRGRCATITHPRMVLFSSGATRPSRSPSRSNSFPANGHKCIPAASLKFSLQQSVFGHPTLSRSGMMEMPEGTEDGFPQPVLMGPSSSRPADATDQTSSTVQNVFSISAHSSASILFSSLFSSLGRDDESEMNVELLENSRENRKLCGQ